MSTSLRKRPKYCVASKGRDVPQAAVSRCSNRAHRRPGYLFDHLVGTAERPRFLLTGDYGISHGDVPGYSGFAPENLTTFAHFSVSSTMSFWKSAGDPARGVPPRSIRRARIWGSTRPALIAPFRVLMIATGVFLGAATPHQLLASSRDISARIRLEWRPEANVASRSPRPRSLPCDIGVERRCQA